MGKTTFAGVCVAVVLLIIICDPRLRNHGLSKGTQQAVAEQLPIDSLTPESIAQSVDPQPKGVPPFKPPIWQGPTTSDIIKLTEAHVSDDVIITEIQSESKIKADKVIALKKVGVGDKVILTLLEDSCISCAASAETAPDEVIAMKKVGVSDKVILALFTASAGTTPGADEK